MYRDVDLHLRIVALSHRFVPCPLQRIVGWCEKL